MAGVSASDAYAAVGGRENAPRCYCHGAAMLWNRDGRKTAGGYFKCAVKAGLASDDWRRDHLELSALYARRSYRACIDRRRAYDTRRNAAREDRGHRPHAAAAA